MSAAARTPPRLRLDPLLGAVSGLLLLLGLVMVASSSIAIADRDLGIPFHYLYRQLVFAGAGLAGALLVLATPMHVWRTLSPLALLVAVLLLGIVLIPGVGHTVNGSTRWLPFGPVNLQVSEPARLLVIVYVAGYLVRRHEALRSSFSGFITPVLPVALCCALLLAEPDFGAAAVLLGTVLGTLFIGGARLRDLLLLVLAGAGVFAALLVSAPYRMARITGFLDPWADPFNSGFQLTQSLIAVGRGEWFGVGLGSGVQKLFYLPEAHTDFVFAILAEELGFLGAALTILLFALLVWRSFAIAHAAGQAQLAFQSYVAYAIAIWLGAQGFLNIGVSLGVLPTKGLTLPLLSYGGSSLLVCCVALAMILRVHHETVLAQRSASPRRSRKKR